jgi:hypothetical protein
VRSESRFGARGVLMPCAAVLTYDCHPDRGRRPADEGSASDVAPPTRIKPPRSLVRFASRRFLPEARHGPLKRKMPASAPHRLGGAFL